MKTYSTQPGAGQWWKQMLAGGVLLAMLMVMSPAGEVRSEDATVDTGNAAASTTVANEVNTTDTSVDAAQEGESTNEGTDASSESSIGGDGADGSDSQGTPGDDVCDDLDLPDDCAEGQQQEQPEAPLQSQEEADGDAAEFTVSASTTNTAELQNTATTSAETGANTAQSSGGSASVGTGSAVSSANVINVVNTNLFNSDGLILLLNILFGGNIDLRNAFSMFGNGADCSLAECDNEDVAFQITNDNFADILNDLVVRSGTGANTASSTDGSAHVETGDAFAGANLVNVVNSNFVDSNYLLVSVNSFGGMGNLILPGASFFEALYGPGACCGGQTTIDNGNTAIVDNNVGVGAESGGNTATSTNSGSTVETGTANAGANVFNFLNGNFFGGTRFFFLIRVYGDWIGDVFNAPAGLSWTEGPGGIQLFNDSAPGGESAGSAGTFGIENSNTALLQNNVSVLALTGDNKAYSENGDATIKTGNAAAGANIINIVNQNVVGQNMIFAIFNIFGNWNGNIMFGQPDVQLFTEADQGQVQNGSCVNYTFTLRNRGDAPAHNVTITPSVSEYLTWQDPAPWRVPRVAAFGTEKVIKTACIANLALGQTAIPTVFETESDEPDGNPANNSDVLELMGYVSMVNGFPRPDVETLDPVWTLTKTSSASSTVPAGGSVTYTIVIKNDGGPGYGSVLVDTLRDTEGKIIKTQKWPLSTVREGEEIQVTYTIAFSDELPEGEYVNEARVLSRGRSIAQQYSVDAHSETTTATVTLGPPLPEQHVLSLSNVRVTAIGGARDSALIEWDTNVPATSQVVYGIESKGGYRFDVEEGGEFYGYPQGTQMIETKTLHHRVLLTGLVPGEAYKYRAVSFASPGVGSDEYAFVLTLPEEEESPISVAAAETKPAASEVQKEGADENRSNAYLAYEPQEESRMATMVPTSSRMSLAAAMEVATDNVLMAAMVVLLGALILFFWIMTRREQ